MDARKQKQEVMVLIVPHNVPQILLLGNGINRAFQGDNWRGVLNHIKTRDDIDANKLNCPMPLQAILITDNHVNEAMKNHRKEFMGTVIPPENMHCFMI